MSAVWQSITRNYRNGRYVGTTSIYTLRRVYGYQVKLNNLTRDIAELGPAIARGVTRELVPHALHSIRVGQTLMFASFDVDREGIGDGRTFLFWSQVQGVEVQQGRVIVKRAETGQAVWKEKAAKIPNLLVFLTVVDEMLRRAN